MSLYFSLLDRSYENLDSYEIAAFVDDECRGVAEKLTLSGDESCLYMRIRSNGADGDKIEFRLRETGSDEFVVLRPADDSDFLFRSNERIGMPSSPFVLARFFNVEVSAGENGSVDFEDGMYKEGTKLSLMAVADEGYHFTMWSDGNEEAERAVIVESDLSLTASFEISSFKAVFIVDGEEYNVVEVVFGEAVPVPEVPEKEGHSFSGWSEIPEKMPAHDIEISGSFTVNIYNVVFKIDGEVFKTLEVPYAQAIEAPEAPAKEGYTFSGWTGIPESMPAHDIEVSGSYTVNVYKAVFKIDGEVFKTLDVAYGAVIFAPEVPEKEGHSFSGWYTIPEIMPAHDIEVLGNFTANKYSLTFVVDGDLFKVLQVAFGAIVEAPEAPEKEGWTFVEWLDLPERMPAADVRVNAAYSVNSYRLTVYLDGEVYLEEDVEFGAEVVVPDPEVPDGRVFEGWKNEVPETMPAHDVDIYGTTAEGNSVALLPFGDDIPADVFSLDGRLLVKGLKTSEVRNRLSSGIYIINGKKIIIK
ncbi:MAG: InlB B-repeat-containing protein [Muribaculaceae bacterium]|nr:InlB B-repeat-containing protein [Muribaculaceae bacterium]